MFYLQRFSLASARLEQTQPCYMLLDRQVQITVWANIYWRHVEELNGKIKTKQLEKRHEERVNYTNRQSFPFWNENLFLVCFVLS